MKKVIVINLLLIPFFVNAQVEYWDNFAKNASLEKFKKRINAKENNQDLSSQIESFKKEILKSNTSGEELFNLLTNWNIFPQQTKKGIIKEMFVELDSVYEAPFYVYIPKNYSEGIPTKLLVYYRGGWISRKEFPEDVSQEIVTENPTFQYLDKYNIIEIYPALKQDLAIYGFHGYKHLRKMINEVKKNFNISDNHVYLAGFSDGGRTVHNIAFLNPTAFASFYSINGTFNSIDMNYANFSNRKMYSFIGEKDDVIYYKLPLSVASASQKYNADWTIKLLGGKGHFYYPYADEILPIMFNHILNTSRNPFPNKITYHKYFDYEELQGIDWLQYTTNFDKKPESWHRNTELKIERSKDKVETILYGEEEAQVEAQYFNNTFDIKASLVDSLEVYLSPLMVNMNNPIIIKVNGEEKFNKKVGIDKEFMLDNFLEKYDKAQVWANKIIIKL